MRLKLMLPACILIDEPVRQVSAEAVEGAFTLLPRHIDFVTVLVPGLLHFIAEDGGEVVLAVAESVLVKRGETVMVSARRAVRGADLATLQATVREEFRQMDERERKARAVLADLESTLAYELARLGRLTR